MKRTLQKSVLIAFVAIISVASSAQFSHPLGLEAGLGCRQGNYSQPRMHVEGNTLYVCTNQGLCSKDLSDDDSAWQLAGFEGVPLQDYVRRGSDMLALRYNNGGNFLLLSHDGGKTYEDVTPEIFCQEKYDVLPCLAQHPTDSNTLLVSSIYWGIFRSTDFGQTWENLTEYMYGNRAASFIGFHPILPSIIFNSGEGYMFEGHIMISYDDGLTWTDHGNSLGFHGDNCVHRPAFNHNNPDCWVVGGEGCVFLSGDCGQTWSCQDYQGSLQGKSYWYFSLFDNVCPNIVYMSGCVNNNSREIRVMCSTDSGKTWGIPLIVPKSQFPVKTTDIVNDLQQTHDNLLIYTETDVYVVSKSELLAQSTVPVQNVTRTSESLNHTSYDLSGRPVPGHPQRGLYIQGGRKVVHTRTQFNGRE